MTARLACVLALLVGAAAFDTPLIGDDPRAPVVVDVPLLCESCLAVVDHVMTTLKRKGKVKNMEVAVSQVLDETCVMEHMKRYKFIPPRMIKGCQKFLDLNDGKFEHLLFGADLGEIEMLTRKTRNNRPKMDALKEQVCAKTLAVCKGVTVDPPRIEKPKVNAQKGQAAPSIRTPDDPEAPPPPPPEKKRTRKTIKKRVKKKTGAKKERGPKVDF